MFGVFEMIGSIVLKAVKWVWEFIKPTAKRAWETAKLTAGIQEVVEYDEYGRVSAVKPMSFSEVPKYMNEHPNNRIYITDHNGRVFNLRTLKEVEVDMDEPRRRYNYRRECDDYYDDYYDDYNRDYRDYADEEVDYARKVEVEDVYEEPTFSEEECEDKALLEMWDSNKKILGDIALDHNWEEDDLRANLKKEEYINDRNEKVVKYTVDDTLQAVMTGTKDEYGNWRYRESSVYGYII